MTDRTLEAEYADAGTRPGMEADDDQPLAALIADRVRSAEEGDADAMFDLGLLFSTGGEAPLDYVTAHKWLNLASMAGSVEARCLRAELALGMSRSEIAESQRQARAWRLQRLH